MAFKISRVQRLSAVLGISLCFFIAEISVGFYTHSLALIADAFHYLNDLVGFAIALAATIIAEKGTPPKTLTFGWQRIQLLGAFFNGVLLFGLGISVFLQSIERFALKSQSWCSSWDVWVLVLIFSAYYFFTSLLTIIIDHSHGHGHGHDHGHSHSHEAHTHTTEDPIALGPVAVDEKHIHHKHHTNTKTTDGKHRDLAMMGVLIHVIGDCANNVGVIIAAAVIWFANYGGRFYADPAVSMGIAIMIFISSIPLSMQTCPPISRPLTECLPHTVKQSGLILLQSAPQGVDHDDVKHDLEKIPGILAIHELHIWRLNQEKALASAHVVLDGDLMPNFESLAQTIRECFHEYGIHSITLQPESYTQETKNTTSVSVGSSTGVDMAGVTGDNFKKRQSLESALNQCKSGCGSFCLEFTCCQ
ncbi:uncharacterized protein N7483_008946 [Penicillium malachiteum]|uniref:uncharacterized protein n=1 Tax=Penicillium malachiteum TaxID=1324776 RepID=UPI00254860C3|nr:uncharacterized protein N7483_008946 [Penicillium malachiteum]KAJ5721012.1 hypothetical protein N7483_008946 [Penicillium malachiteum]